MHGGKKEGGKGKEGQRRRCMEGRRRGEWRKERKKGIKLKMR